MDLTEEQWQIVQPFIPVAGPRGRRGRPAMEQRVILDGVLYKLTTGCSWDAIPVHYAGWQTCYAYYKCWRKAGVLEKIIRVLLRDVRERGGFNYFQAAKQGDVHLIRRGHRYQVFILAVQAADIKFHGWQFATSMLFYQKLACQCEKLEGIVRRTDPFRELTVPSGETAGRGGA